ncbi:divergent polysaccharide deacetylase family protein [Pararhodospirillum photometricum]|nr:divergent polysaccharide deacetylase family protein [Pararhodospirillum photometricum]
MAELKRRGLVWLDSVTSPQTVGLSLARAAGVPHAGRAVFLDNVPERAAVDRQLANLEAAARRNGVAIGIGHPKDATIQGLRAWLPSLARKGITLVPVSALMRVETTTVARRP